MIKEQNQKDEAQWCIWRYRLLLNKHLGLHRRQTRPPSFMSPNKVSGFPAVKSGVHQELGALAFS